mgnify:CR=1 FL=1
MESMSQEKLNIKMFLSGDVISLWMLKHRADYYYLSKVQAQKMFLKH